MTARSVAHVGAQYCIALAIVFLVQAIAWGLLYDPLLQAHKTLAAALFAAASVLEVRARRVATRCSRRLAAGVGTFSWAVRGVCGAISSHTCPSPRATLPRRRPASTATSTTSSARAASPARVDRGCALTMSNSFVSFHECV